MACSLEDKPGTAADQSVDYSATVRAFRERRFGDALVALEPQAAGLTLVFVGRHDSSLHAMSRGHLSSSIQSHHALLVATSPPRITRRPQLGPAWGHFPTGVTGRFTRFSSDTLQGREAPLDILKGKLDATEDEPKGDKVGGR